MAESYNLNSSFGLNVTARGAKTNAYPIETISENAFGNLFSSVDKYLQENEDVFNGSVEHEIDLYTRQSMIIGMNLRNANGPVRKLDVSM